MSFGNWVLKLSSPTKGALSFDKFITDLIFLINVCNYLELRSAISIYLRMLYFTKQNQLCSIMSEQPIELLSVKIKLLGKTLLHYITANTVVTRTNWGNQCTSKKSQFLKFQPLGRGATGT